MIRVVTVEERLRCAAAHVAAIGGMVARDVPCGEVVCQIRAVDGSLQAVVSMLVQQETRKVLRTRPAEAALSDVRSLFGALQRDGRSGRVFRRVPGEPSRGA